MRSSDWALLALRRAARLFARPVLCPTYKVPSTVGAPLGQGRLVVHSFAISFFLGMHAPAPFRDSWVVV
jgi:hypothetical protein